MEYELNKGIGQSAEFKGLKAQYLFIFAGGLLAVFVVFIVMYMAGTGQWVCIAFGAVSASILVWLTFRLKRQVRRARADETARQTAAPAIPD